MLVRVGGRGDLGAELGKRKPAPVRAGLRGRSQGGDWTPEVSPLMGPSERPQGAQLTGDDSGCFSADAGTPRKRERPDVVSSRGSRPYSQKEREINSCMECQRTYFGFLNEA